ncbi:hypothetical protein [Streptomyces sp. NPDC059491]
MPAYERESVATPSCPMPHAPWLVELPLQQVQAEADTAGGINGVKR